MFKKPVVLEQEPKPISDEDGSADLLVDETDCLYSDEVRIIISGSETMETDSKLESLNSKSFRTIDKILQIKEDLLTKKKLLEEKFCNLETLSNELSQVQFTEMYSQK